MQTLENLYEIKHKNHNYFDRKIVIDSKKIIITGVSKSGKTHLIIDYLSNFRQENILYIDLLDARVDTTKVTLYIHKFVISKPIEILVIENFDFSFELPDVTNIILTSKNNKIKLKNFIKISLYPLDFEEFISFDKRHFNVEHLFNLYTTLGSFPVIVLDGSNNNPLHVQEMLKQMLDEKIEFEIFKKLSELTGHKISFFQIYNQLKIHMKISKDKLYEKMQKLEQEQMIFLVEKFLSPKANKKLFLIDFTLKNALTFKKDFLKSFENILFLELMKKKYKVFYTDFIDLYIPQKNYAIFCIPFLTQELIRSKLLKIVSNLKDLHVEKVDIVTIGNEGNFVIEDIKCSILPFWNWALQD